MKDDVFEKKNVKVKLDIAIDWFENIQQFIDNLKILYPQYQLYDIKVESAYDEVLFFVHRLETDEEYEARIKPYTAKLKEKEEKERKEYERLKAKFEGTKNS